MIYAIFSLSEIDPLAAVAEEEQVDLPDRVIEAVGKNIYSKYAPMAWFVQYDGTADQLVDLMWPDDEEPPGGYEIDAGMVVDATAVIGYVSGDLWEWVRVNSER